MTVFQQPVETPESRNVVLDAVLVEEGAGRHAVGPGNREEALYRVRAHAEARQRPRISIEQRREDVLSTTQLRRHEAEEPVLDDRPTEAAAELVLRITLGERRFFVAAEHEFVVA